MDLARFAMKGILDKTALDPSLLDYVNFGTVIQGQDDNEQNTFKGCVCVLCHIVSMLL